MIENTTVIKALHVLPGSEVQTITFPKTQHKVHVSGEVLQ